MGKNKKKAKNTNWKSYQTDSKTKRKVFLGLITLGAIILIILFAKLVAFLVSINQPFNPQTPHESTNYTSTSSTLTVAVKADNNYLLTVNPVDKKMTLIRVSGEIILPGSEVKVKDIEDGKELSKAFQKAFGTYIDGYLIFPENSGFKFENFASGLKKGTGTLYLLQNVKTDMSLLGLVNLSWKARGIREDNFNIIDLSSSPASRWQFSNGARSLVVDQGLLDRQLQGDFEDNKLNLEGLNIAIYNSTDHPGLAEKAARVITNMGGRVITTDTVKEHFDNSLVFGKKSYTLARLEFVYHATCPKGLFGTKDCAKISDELKKNDQGFDASSSKADVVVILGEDLYTQLN